MLSATDLCRVWGGKDGWLILALVIDCHTRELLGWQLSRSGKASTAGAALEQALIARNGSLGRVQNPFLLRSDHGLVFTSRSLHALRVQKVTQKWYTVLGFIFPTISRQVSHSTGFDFEPFLQFLFYPTKYKSAG